MTGEDSEKGVNRRGFALKEGEKNRGNRGLSIGEGSTRSGWWGGLGYHHKSSFEWGGRRGERASKGGKEKKKKTNLLSWFLRANKSP